MQLYDSRSLVVRHEMIDMASSYSNQAKKRRVSENTGWETSSPYHRKGSRSIRTCSSSNSSSPTSWQWIPSQQQSEQQVPFDQLDYIDVQSAALTASGPQPIIKYDGNSVGISAPPPSLVSSASLAFDIALAQSIMSSPESPGLEVFTPSSSYMGSQPDDIPQSDCRSGSFASLNSVTSSSLDTMASARSDDSAYLDTSIAWDSSRPLKDLAIADRFYEMISHSPHSFVHTAINNSKEVSSDDMYAASSQGWDFMNDYPTFKTTWPLSDPNLPQFSENQDSARGAPFPRDPWSVEDIQQSPVEFDAGIMAFGLSPGYPHKVFEIREPLFHPPNPRPPYVDPQSSFLDKENDHSYRHQLPHRDIAPPTCDKESSCEAIESHEHVFSAITGMGMPDNHRGQKRKLTSEERQRILEVRKGGACWACHLSKTKCSPCSSGTPCEQCARLVGKRRFCLLPCFNDPIESLSTFLVPDCLVSHFTKANVEAFIGQHASHWGTYTISVRISWGCRRLLPVNVVALYTLGDASELGYNHQAFTDSTGRVELVRNKCAPLGIPLADMDDMQKQYRSHIQDVIRHDLFHYVSVAYENERSQLAECLLGAVCRWYRSGVEVNNENALVREAIEIHIVSTILKRSLILDEASLGEVQDRLGHQYPSMSAPRGAQRQIKLAFYMEQRPRIIRVLKEWGKLMRSSAASEKRWATAFCVFIVLALVMDKTIAAAHNFCESRIKFKGRNASTEREKFENLRRLMETELFEKCKEIFHCRYKTRKGGNERCNPIRDGISAWRGEPVDERTSHLVVEIQGVVRDFWQDITTPQLRLAQFNTGAYKHARLASIFLNDF